MATASSEALTLSIIRGKLSHLINRRAKAYEVSIRKGYTIPAYAEKISAIKALRAQLNGSSSWNLQSNLRWIHAMKDQLMKILPSEFHDDEKQKRYRKHMLDLISFCEDLLDSKSILNHKPHLYATQKNSESKGNCVRQPLWLFGNLFQ